MKVIGAALLCVASQAWALGDMTAFSNLLGAAVVTQQADITAAMTKRAQDQAACAKVASRPKRDKCYSSALTVFNGAIASAENRYDFATLAGAGTFLGVPGTTVDVDAELMRLEAIRFAQDFAIQQARIDACLAANMGSTDPNVCDELTGY